MKIGIDIDGVILEFERELQVEAELFDIIELKRNSLVNDKERKFYEKYNWSNEEKQKFIDDNFIKLTKRANVVPGAKEVIDLLKKDGHELIVISARGGMVAEMKGVALEKLEQNDLSFDKYYWKCEKKLEICKKENIDIMIDDYYVTCKKLAENSIRTLYFREYPNYELEENEYLKEVHNWGEIYRYVHEIGGK